MIHMFVYVIPRRWNEMSSKLLITPPFETFLNWDVKQFFIKEVLSKYPVEKLGKHIIHQTDKIQLSNYPDKKFGILGVSNKIGMFDADSLLGKTVKQKYHIVRDNWLAYNPYRVNVGSIGLKTPKQKGEYISPAYVVFSCKDTLLPEYIWLLMKSNMFNTLIRNSTTGTVRQTLGYDSLAEISAPIPSIIEQQRLLDEYHAAFNKANALITLAESINSEIDMYLYDYFNMDSSEDMALGASLLKTFKLSNSVRWDVDYALNDRALDYLDNCNCLVVPASKFILSTQYGLSEKASVDNSGIPMLRMGNIRDSEVDLTDIKYISKTDALKGRYLDKGDLLFNRTNSKELVGKTAVFDLDGDYVFASYIIRVKIDSTMADINFINYMFSSRIIRRQIDIVSRQILGQVNMNVDELSNLRFPLPSLPEQKKIVSEIDKIRNRRKSAIRDAYTLITKGNADFENTIFA